MATENVRIVYTTDDKQLKSSNKELEKTIGLNNLTQKEVDETTEKFEDQNKELKKTSTAFSGLGGQLTSLGNRFQIAGKGVGDMATSMFTATRATQGTSKAMRILKVAIASTGIGLLIIAIGSLSAAFKSSETGQNKFAKIMDTIGVIVGNVSDIFANIGEKIIAAFESPKKTINSFVDILKNNVINRFNGLLELVPQLGKAFTQLFKGDFAGAAETAGNAVAKVTLGVEDFTDKVVDGFTAATDAVVEFGKQTAKEVNQAQALADKRAATDILARQFLVDTAKLESQVADLRLKGRQEDQFTADERLAFLNEANDLQNQLITTELTIANNRAEEATISNTFSKSTKENLDAEAQLKAVVFQIEAKRLNQQRTLQREINTTSKQAQTALDQEAKANQALVDQKIESETNLNIFRLEQEGMLEEAEIAKRERLLENEALNAEEREIIIGESEERILDIKKTSEEQALLVKKKGTDAIKGLIAQGLGDTKAGAIFTAGLDTQAAAIAAFKAVVGIPIVGPALAPIAAGAATAFGLSGIAKIANIGLPKFEKGGKIGGHLHTSGGTLIEAERDEFVMSRKATSKYGFDMMDKINNMELDPNILTGQTGGSNVVIVDNSELAKEFRNRPEKSVIIDSDGYTVFQERQHAMTIQKANRYST